MFLELYSTCIVCTRNVHVYGPSTHPDTYKLIASSHTMTLQDESREGVDTRHSQQVMIYFHGRKFVPKENKSLRAG
jgi:hypothetical protein